MENAQAVASLPVTELACYRADYHVRLMRVELQLLKEDLQQMRHGLARLRANMYAVQREVVRLHTNLISYERYQDAEIRFGRS